MSLAVHNVVQLSDDEVLARFVVRQSELEALLEHLREPDPPRHALVVGPRGMGKSLLLRRVAIAVAANEELAARWLPVIMAEELYEVTSIGELWLAALARVADQLGDPALVEQHGALRAERDPQRLESLALERLLGAGRDRGKQVLLLAENFDMLLGDQVPSEEGWTLRQALQTEHELLLMASAVTNFAGLEDGDEPFYGFFHRIDLRPLDDDEVAVLWKALTDAGIPRARALAVRILTGGNPRLITVLARFTKNPDLSCLRQDLELLIDEYTPFFKANIEALPPVERKVFVTLADIWAPATAAEVAERARMETSKVSALLGRLMRRGAVEVVEDDEPGRRRYELTERLYNLYHLLRRPSADGRVRALVDILVHLYEPPELGHVVWPRIAGVSSDVDAAIAARVHRHLESVGALIDMSPEEMREHRAALEGMLDSQRASLGADHADVLLTRGQLALMALLTDNIEEALSMHRQLTADCAIALGGDHPETLKNKFRFAYCLDEVGDPDSARKILRDLAADLKRLVGANHRNTLETRLELAYCSGQLNDASTGLQIVEDVIERAEATLTGDDQLLILARSLRAMLFIDAAFEESLPRELRVLRDAQRLSPRRPARGPRRPPTGPRRGS